MEQAESVSVEWPPDDRRPPGTPPCWSLVFEFTTSDDAASPAWTSLRIERHGLHELSEEEAPLISAALLREVPWGTLERQARASLPTLRRLQELALHEAKRKGLLKRGRGRPRLDDDHYAAVADVYNRASRDRRPPTRAVQDWAAEQRGLRSFPRSTASRWIREARRRGLIAT